MNAPTICLRAQRVLRAVACCAILALSPAFAQAPPDLIEPMVGTPGKDVVYVPQPAEVVDQMLDVAGVGPNDFVIDLGSGDGRNVIAAARRGARALGVEYNPEFVEYSRRAAIAAGVRERASFVQGDMYEADISKATVLALFLLTENLRRLRPKFLALKPGTRIVINTFKIEEWEPDQTVRASPKCNLWCDLQLYIVPARVAGTWTLPGGELVLEQRYQMLSGALFVNGQRLPLENARMRGEHIVFVAGGKSYEGRAMGNRMEGTVKGGGAWTATRTRS